MLLFILGRWDNQYWICCWQVNIWISRQWNTLQVLSSYLGNQPSVTHHIHWIPNTKTEDKKCSNVTFFLDSFGGEGCLRIEPILNFVKRMCRDARKVCEPRAWPERALSIKGQFYHPNPNLCLGVAVKEKWILSSRRSTIPLFFAMFQQVSTKGLLVRMKRKLESDTIDEQVTRARTTNHHYK